MTDAAVVLLRKKMSGKYTLFKVSQVFPLKGVGNRLHLYSYLVLV